MGRRVESVGASDEHRALQEMIERSQADFASIVNDRLCRTVDERADILNSVPGRFRSFLLEILDVSDLADQLLNQNIDARVLGSLAKSVDHAGKIREGFSGRRAQRLLE